MKKKIIIIFFIFIGIFLISQIKVTFEIRGEAQISLNESSVELPWKRTYTSKIIDLFSFEESQPEDREKICASLENFFKGAEISYNISEINFLKIGEEK